MNFCRNRMTMVRKKKEVDSKLIREKLNKKGKRKAQTYSGGRSLKPVIELKREMPKLDLKFWIKDGRIKYDFVEKTMSNNTILHAKTPQSETTKFAYMSQEVVSRLLHASRSLRPSHRMENLETFCQKMTKSGNNKQFIRM